jgi:hypothetical protein
MQSRSITRAALSGYLCGRKTKSILLLLPSTLAPHTLHAAAELMEISIGVHHARRCHGCLPLLLILRAAV